MASYPEICKRLSWNAGHGDQSEPAVDIPPEMPLVPSAVEVQSSAALATDESTSSQLFTTPTEVSFSTCFAAGMQHRRPIAPPSKLHRHRSCLSPLKNFEQHPAEVGSIQP